MNFTHADILAAQREISSRHLSDFFRLMWPQVEPVAAYSHNWHIDSVCEHLEAVTAGQITRLLINVPPGSSKSLICSVAWNAWEWGPKNLTSNRYLCTSFNETPVKRDTRKTRDLILSPWYQTLWPHVKLTRTAELSFANTKTGSREGVPFPSLTSQRGDRLIIDDPHSTETAESDLERTRTTRLFREGAINRLNDQMRSAIVVIMQRLHTNDVSGEILANDMGFDHLMIPMEFEADRRKTTSIGFADPRRIDGDLLDAKRFPPPAISELRNGLGTYAYCTPKESPILMGDLSLRPIGEIEVGDSIIGFTGTEDGARRRHLVPTRVVAISRSVRPVVRMAMSSGKVIRCTADHKWFTGRGSHENRRRHAYSKADIGSILRRICDDVMPTIPAGSERLAGWLAGFFDADGSVSLMQKNSNHRASSLIQFTQGSGRNLPLCQKLESALRTFGFDFGYGEREPEGRAHCGNYSIRQYYLRGNSLPMFQKFLHAIGPTKWRDRIASGGLGANFIIGKETVVSIEPDGEEEVFGLTTETGNYVVWGFASSNSGQYQQRPTAREGGLFKRSWFDGKIRPVKPQGGRSCRAWDLAGTVKKTGNRPDWTVGLRMWRCGSDYWIDHVERLQASPGEVVKTIKSHAATDPFDTAIRIPQDPGQAGKAQAENLVIELSGRIVKAVPVTGDKETRARPCAVQAEAGNVYLVGEPGDKWIATFLDEICTFPMGSHDDQVDAMSDAFNELALGSTYTLEHI